MPDPETIEAYEQLLSSAPQGERKYLGIAIRHPQISEPYFFVQDNVELVATDEEGQIQTFTPVSLDAELSKSSDDLDQGGLFSLLVDTRNLKTELAGIPLDSKELPELNFITWVTGHLDDPLEVYFLHISEVSWQKGKATFRAVTPQLDLSQTGFRYAVDDYPVLRGVL